MVRLPPTPPMTSSVETGNESYRFRHSTMASKTRIKARESERKGSKAVSIAGAPDEPF